MNLAPQVETAEISDTDLDTVSGGQAGGSPVGVGLGAAAGLYAEAGPLSVAAGLGAGVTPEGVAADLNLRAAVQH
ncbi:hypothetical protein [Streptomyces sp. NPDC050546]|uniref:hypothetical protein n=1 Tax=Streptomyces sp. NPDC050546 TaxID=3365628 RepID=UPI00379A5E76